MLDYFRRNFLQHIRANIATYFFIILIFAIGIVIGALAVRFLPDDQKAELIGYLRIFFNGLNNKGEMADITANLGPVLLNNVKTIVLMWLLGFTIVGIPVVMVILFTRGFVIGFTIGFLINEYIFKGLFFALVSILPHNFFAIPAVLITGVSATTFSLLLIRKKLRPKTSLLYEAVGYSLLCFISLGLMIIAGLVEVYVSPVLMKLVAGLILKE